MYKWVLANLMLGVTLRWTGIPFRGEWIYPKSLHATETGDKHWSYGPRDPDADFTFFITQTLSYLDHFKRLSTDSKICYMINDRVKQQLKKVTK